MNCTRRMPLKHIRQYYNSYDRRLWVLSLGWFVSALGFAVSIPFIAIYFHAELGLSVTQIGLFFGVMAVVRSIFQILGGEVADRVERRAMLIYCQYIRAATFVLLALAVYRDWGLSAVAACLLVNSIFGALFQPTANAMVADILPARTADGRLCHHPLGHEFRLGRRPGPGRIFWPGTPSGCCF